MHKTDKQFFFEAGLNWLADDRGVLYAHDVKEIIHVAAPAAFGGTGKEWSPEHLLLSSIISCYMSTYLGISKKMNLTVSRFECNAIGQVELVEGKYRFTNINVYPKIFIADETVREKAGKAAEKTQQYCLISNSLHAAMIYHTAILIAPQATTATGAAENKAL
jgi:peroxiredoxin-like protein